MVVVKRNISLRVLKYVPLLHLVYNRINTLIDGNTSTIRRQTRNNSNTALQKNPNQTPTYKQTDYFITTDILLIWYICDNMMGLKFYETMVISIGFMLPEPSASMIMAKLKMLLKWQHYVTEI